MSAIDPRDIAGRLPVVPQISEESRTLLLGVSLEQYAGVLAALAERHSIAKVLEQERIDSATWPLAERAWREAIVDSPDLQVGLMQKRRVAEECLGRPIDPLDDDPSAWVGLLAALALSEQPASVVDGLGLTMGDVARLGRSWKRKAEADANLAKELAELGPKAKAPTSVTARAAELRPFPWTPKRQDAPTPPPAPTPSPTKSPEAERPQSNESARQLASFQLRGQEPVARPATFAAPSASRPIPPAQAAPPITRKAAVAGDLTALAPAVASASPVVPFERPPQSAHGISLSRYTEVVAALQEQGANTANVLADFGLDAEQYREVVAAYEAKLKREASSAAEFGRLLVGAQRRLAARRAEPPARHLANAPEPTATVPPLGVISVDETEAVDLRAIHAALPFLFAAEPSAHVEGSAREAPPSPPPVGSETEAVDRSVLLAGIGRALPFDAGASSSLPRKTTEVPVHEPTGTEAISRDELAGAIAAADLKSSGAARAQRTVDPIVATLAAIAVDIRRGTNASAAIAARNMTDGAWRAAQHEVVNDPEMRKEFTRLIDELLSTGNG